MPLAEAAPLAPCAEDGPSHDAADSANPASFHPSSSQNSDHGLPISNDKLKTEEENESPQSDSLPNSNNSTSPTLDSESTALNNESPPTEFPAPNSSGSPPTSHSMPGHDQHSTSGPQNGRSPASNHRYSPSSARNRNSPSAHRNSPSSTGSHSSPINNRRSPAANGHRATGNGFGGGLYPGGGAVSRDVAMAIALAPARNAGLVAPSATHWQSQGNGILPLPTTTTGILPIPAVTTGLLPLPTTANGILPLAGPGRSSVAPIVTLAAPSLPVTVNNAHLLGATAAASPSPMTMNGNPAVKHAHANLATVTDHNGQIPQDLLTLTLTNGKLFIGALSQSTTTAGLRRYFESYGHISECFIKLDEMGRSRGFGFLSFTDPYCAWRVLNSGPHVVDDKTLDCKPAVPPNMVKSPDLIPHKKVFVGGLPSECGADDLKAYFSTFGAVEHTMVMMDQKTKCSRGFGYVTFRDKDTATKVCHIRKHYLLNKSKPVECRPSLPKSALQAAQNAAEDASDSLPSPSSSVGIFTPTQQQQHFGNDGHPPHINPNALVGSPLYSGHASATAAAAAAMLAYPPKMPQSLYGSTTFAATAANRLQQPVIPVVNATLHTPNAVLTATPQQAWSTGYSTPVCLQSAVPVCGAQDGVTSGYVTQSGSMIYTQNDAGFGGVGTQLSLASPYLQQQQQQGGFSAYGQQSNLISPAGSMLINGQSMPAFTSAYQSPSIPTSPMVLQSPVAAATTPTQQIGAYSVNPYSTSSYQQHANYAQAGVNPLSQMDGITGMQVPQQTEAMTPNLTPELSQNGAVTHVTNDA